MRLVFDEADERYDAVSGAVIVRARDPRGREIFGVVTEEALRAAPRRKTPPAGPYDMYRETKALFQAVIEVKYSEGDITSRNEVIVRPDDLGL